MSKENGLNNFDIIFYINLNHRKDRYEAINNELAKTNIDKEKINRIEAIYYQTLPTIGCAKSHILALESFIQSGKDTCIIFEDDFEFTIPQEEINKIINSIFNSEPNFDVLMLSSNTIFEIPTHYNYLTKIIDAQTLSGYCVSKNFAPILLENFKESIVWLEGVGYSVPDYCVDMYMKKLQPNSNWYCIHPKIGRQRETYSDIENRVVCYNC